MSPLENKYAGMGVQATHKFCGARVAVRSTNMQSPWTVVGGGGADIGFIFARWLDVGSAGLVKYSTRNVGIAGALDYGSRGRSQLR